MVLYKYWQENITIHEHPAIVEHEHAQHGVCPLCLQVLTRQHQAVVQVRHAIARDLLLLCSDRESTWQPPVSPDRVTPDVGADRGGLEAFTGVSAAVPISGIVATANSSISPFTLP